jgi:hypothetical protein
MAADLLSTIRDEIDARLRELRPLLAEYERLLVAADALDSQAESSSAAVEESSPSTPIVVPKRRGRRPSPRKTARVRGRTRVRGAAPARRSATDETILGILEHGSHTVGELAVVTALSAASLNGSLRRLHADGAVAKTERAGKIAWALHGSE